MTAAFVVIVGATSRDGAGGTGGRFACVIGSLLNGWRWLLSLMVVVALVFICVQ
jgi:hypothetical protein